MEAKTYFDVEKKLWKGPDALPTFNPEVSIGEVLLKSFTVFGPKVAQVLNIHNQKVKKICKQ